MDPRTRRMTRRITRRERRRSTNVFSSVSQAKIQLFREAFNMIDQDGDGHISKQDLRDVLTSLGTTPTDDVIEQMLSDGPGGPINFTCFLTMFANKTSEMDDEETLRNAFSILDDEGKGFIDARELATLLNTVEYERLSQEEVALLLRKAPISQEGKIDVEEFLKILIFENEFS